MVQVRIVGVALDSRGQPLILLKPLDAAGGERMLPIWIGAQEATSILIAVEGEEAGIVDEGDRTDPVDQEERVDEFRKFLDEVDPEDFQG
jgi:hypothetical protein